MSYYKHPLDDIHVGDHVVMEVTERWHGEESYTFQVSGQVRKYDGVKCIGRHGLGDGKIIEHRPRPLPTTFGSHIRYPDTGVEWVKTHGENWVSSKGGHRLNREIGPGWVLVHDAAVKS